MALEMGSTSLATRHPICLRPLSSPKNNLMQRCSLADRKDLSLTQASRSRAGTYMSKQFCFGLTENKACFSSTFPSHMNHAFWYIGSGNAPISPRYADSALAASSLTSTGLAFVIHLIVDAILFIIRLPGMVIAFIRKEKPVIEEVEEKLDDALDVVDETAKVIEGVAESVEKASEVFGKDARATEELMRKVETTSEKIKSDVDIAVGFLESTTGADHVSHEADVAEKHDVQPSKISEEQTKPEEPTRSKMTASTSAQAGLHITHPEIKRGCAEINSSFDYWDRYKNMGIGSYLSSKNQPWQENEMLWRLLRTCLMAMVITASFQLQILPSLRTTILRLILLNC